LNDFLTNVELYLRRIKKPDKECALARLMVRASSLPTAGTFWSTRRLQNQMS
jgi:hypothetical protein